MIKINKWGWAAISCATAGWIAIIIASGYGWNLFKAPSDFSNTGSFGDSFGPLSAVMAGVAALSAIGALNSQREEVSRLRLRESEEDIRSRRGDFERTFFQLLQAWRQIQMSVDIQGSGPPREGQDAFRVIARSFESSPSVDPKVRWDKTYFKYRNDLGHYFRFLYHIVKYVDSTDGIDKYFYVRLVRASLSDSEIFLLALNCLYGEGREKFKCFIERYALLHNISPQYRRNHLTGDLFKDSAFSRP